MIALLGAAAVTGGAVAGASAQAQSAADLAALAAAHQARDARALGRLHGADVCASAREVADANGVGLDGCSVAAQGVVHVTVTVTVSGWIGALRVSRHATAGPRHLGR